MKRNRGTAKVFPCTKCFHCKTRTFSSVTALTAWCGRKSLKPNKTWINNLIDFKWLRLIWCDIQTDQYCSHGMSPRNASPKHTADITGDVIPMDGKQVVITNQNKDAFIKGAWEDCPYYEKI